jgi:tetratricopeptide (TPR) repeat protein
MPDTPEAVLDALRENNERPYGLPRTVAAEELVAAAEQFEEPDVLVTALLELMEAYEYTGEHRKSPVVFARVLQLWDGSPDAFSEWEGQQVYWRFKWVTTSLLEVPDVPLATVEQWIGRMRERYREAGHGMQPVAAMAHRVALHTGSGLEAAYDLWVTRPRERLSDCEACEIRHRALHHLALGDDERALEVWAPLFAGAVSCQEEPYVSHAFALLPLLRAGRTDEARSHHLAGYRYARGRTGMAEEIGLHLEFCALTRNEGRGLEILAENRELFGATGAPKARLAFLTGVQVLLGRLAEEGYADTPVAGPSGRQWTARTLLAEIGAEADGLAAAFDRRNGTASVGERRRARLARRPLLDEPLPLGLRVTPLTGPADGEAAPAPAPAAHRVAVPEDFAELVAEARRLADDGHPGDTPLWERIAERVADGGYVHDPALGHPDRLLAELAEQRGFAEDERGGDGRAAMAEAADLYVRAGLPWHGLAARARAACRTEQGRDGASGDASGDHSGVRRELDSLLERAERMLPGGDREPDAEFRPDKYLVVLQCRTFAAHAELTDRLPDAAPEAVARFEEAVAALHAGAERWKVPHQTAAAHLYAADVAARTGRLEEAAERQRRSQEILEETGTPWRATRGMLLLGQILMRTGRAGDAAEVFRQAMARAARYDDRSFPATSVHAMLGHACKHAGELPGAVRHLSEAAARLDREGDHNGAAECRLELADALAASGQPEDAVAVLESVVREGGADSGSPLDERLLAQIRLTLARGLSDLEEHRAAAEEFLRLADTVAGWEERFTHTMVASQAAVALARDGRREAAGAARERALESHREAPNPGPVLEMLREFADLATRGEEGDAEAALGHLAAADGLLADASEDPEDFPRWYHAGQNHLCRARCLARTERFDEALGEAERADARFAEGGPDGAGSRAEAARLAAVVEGNGLGRPEAAVARLDAAIHRCAGTGLDEAVRILTALREDMASR